MLRCSREIFFIGALASVSGVAALAQSVISAHSGVLHYSEGAVFVGGQQVDNSKFGVFPDIKENGHLRTEQGRAEVLLTPGVFLRVGESSDIRMITNRLIDTRVEIVSGSAMVESDDPLKDNAVTIVYKDFTVSLKKHGIYGFETDPPQLKVYSGEAEVESGGNRVTVREGKLLPFTAAMAIEKFDSKEGDSLYVWSKRRSSYVSVANLSAAKQVSDNSSTWNSASWYFNPYYGMYTYIPMRGTYINPFGYGFYSPYTVYSAYSPRYYGGGYNNNSSGSSGFGNNLPLTSTGRSAAVSVAATPSVSNSVSSGSVSRAGGGSGGSGHAGGSGH